jgi:predicted transcriptional regulator
LFGILKSCASDKLSINQLLISQNLSYRQLKSYLDQLAGAKLIVVESEENKRLVGTTKQGIDALELYRGAISALRHPMEARNA